MNAPAITLQGVLLRMIHEGQRHGEITVALDNGVEARVLITLAGVEYPKAECTIEAPQR